MSLNAQQIRQEQCVKNKLWIIDVGFASKGYVSTVPTKHLAVGQSKVGKRIVKAFKKS